MLDQLYRSIWHCLPALRKIDRMIFPYGGDDFPLLDMAKILNLAKLYLSRDFDPAIAEYAPSYSETISLVQVDDISPSAYDELASQSVKAIIVWHTGSDQVVSAAQSLAKKIRCRHCLGRSFIGAAGNSIIYTVRI